MRMHHIHVGGIDTDSMAKESTLSGCIEFIGAPDVRRHLFSGTNCTNTSEKLPLASYETEFSTMTTIGVEGSTTYKPRNSSRD